MPLNAPLAARPAEEAVVLETRFGTYAFDADSEVHMPRGPLGFADHRRFALADLPQAIGERFKLLQSLEDADLGFVVAVLPQAAGLIDEADLEEACEASGIERGRAEFLLVVTIRPNEAGDGIAMSVNLRAPLVLDPERRVARQHVFSSSRYAVRQPLQAAEAGG